MKRGQPKPLNKTSDGRNVIGIGSITMVNHTLRIIILYRELRWRPPDGTWDIVTAANRTVRSRADLQMAIDTDDRVHLTFYNSSDNVWYAVGR